MEFLFVGSGHAHVHTQACAHTHVHAHACNTGSKSERECTVGPAMSCVFRRTDTCTRMWFLGLWPRRVYTRAGSFIHIAGA